MKICIDPGHGMPDPGALGSFSREADVNLAVALILRNHLLRSGIKVVMTREGSDRILPNNYTGDLQARCDIANRAKADYFLSIHANAATQTARGTETYCFRRGGVAERFATAIQKAAVSFAQSVDRGVKTASFYVLRNTNMPAALLEMLFISNPAEEAKLTDPAWQAGMARALAQGISEFVDIPFVDEVPRHPIMGESEATREQMEGFVHAINPSAPYLADMYLKIGKKEGVRGDMAYAQSIKETGYFRFGGRVSPQQNNFSGLGATGDSNGASFATPEDGILAQIQHLKAYASTEPLNTPLIDPRFDLVTRGIAPYWEDLNGRWAVPGTNYGQDIVRIWNNIKEVPINDSIGIPGSGALTDNELETLIQLLSKLLSAIKGG